MSDEPKLHKVERLKEASRQLRGTIAEEMATDEDHVSGDAAQLLKHHGSYQQDNRDARGSAQKEWMFMVRTRVPGGKLTAEQLLAELDLGDRYGNGTLRITSRQGLQLHGVLKRDLRETIRAINAVKLTTFAACGDVERNVMCCPAPINDSPVRRDMQALADRLAEHLKPRTTAYYQIWLQDENGEQTDVTPFTPVDEPIYGARYLPRKFKTGIALPEDNCVDILTYDLGLLAVVQDDSIAGYNIFVGGGQGTTPAVKTTFPALAQKMTFVPPRQVVDVAEAIVKVQRDFGNRSDRKQARLKYLIANWGLDAFKSKVEEYYGAALPDPDPADVTGVDDHLGWHAQGDGRLFLGINVANGRIQDDGTLRLKTALGKLLERYKMPTRLTALQSVILCDIDPADRHDIDAVLADHGIRPASEQSPLRRFAIACPSFPTCGLSITESERVMPQILDRFEVELERLGLADERIAIHTTGCPNGCARPYSSDIGLVGKARGRYTVFLGGNALGTRLAFNFRDMVPLEEIVPTVAPVLAAFKADRKVGESFGDFCARQGKDELALCAEQVHSRGA